MANSKKKLLSEAEQQMIIDIIDEQSIPYQYNTKEWPVEVLVSKYDKQEIFVPMYQRNFVWDIKLKSKFIESVFLGVPIMPFLVSMSGDDAELEIVDGSQRIRTLVDFVKDMFVLKGLEKLAKLNGLKFSQLPRYVQRKFLLRDFRFHVITDKATTEIRADIFGRVNTSYKKLSDSEIRKGAYQGEFYKFLQDCSKNKLSILKKLCPIPEAKVERGEYDELILRFFAYSERYLDFKHDVAPFLDNFVLDMKGKTDFSSIEKDLDDVLRFVENNLPPPYFARPGRDKATARVRFEALSVGIHLALKTKPNLTVKNVDWLFSEEFRELTTSDASNNQGKLRSRIEFVRDSLLHNSN